MICTDGPAFSKDDFKRMNRESDEGFRQTSVDGRGFWMFRTRCIIVQRFADGSTRIVEFSDLMQFVLVASRLEAEAREWVEAERAA